MFSPLRNGITRTTIGVVSREAANHTYCCTSEKIVIWNIETNFQSLQKQAIFLLRKLRIENDGFIIDFCGPFAAARGHAIHVQDPFCPASRQDYPCVTTPGS